MLHIATTHPFFASLEHILGFFIVVLALSLLWTVTALIGRYFIGQEAARPAAATPVIPDEGPTDEEVAAISAVVVAIMGSRSRVVSIRSSSGKDWSREGRREHFASHRIR